MDMREIREEFFGAPIRPEVIIHLGTQCLDDSSWPSQVSDAFSFDAEKIWEAIGIAPPDEDADEKWAIESHLRRNNKFGFLVEFATPVPLNFDSNGEGHSFTWGYTALKWIYADSFELACEAAIKWQDEYLAKMLAEHKAKTAA
ncbi:hypothetical protein [Aeromonas hydrophila]|uniref:hypothetical protein n=1 Tax=Aeromonas hydrophila TaxID=644 RepID=UPI002B482290|nr:hypothetical protein [Aeromonas hydrophila]